MSVCVTEDGPIVNCLCDKGLMGDSQSERFKPPTTDQFCLTEKGQPATKRSLEVNAVPAAEDRERCGAMRWRVRRQTFSRKDLCIQKRPCDCRGEGPEKKNRGQPIRVESRQRIQQRTCLYDRKRPASNESHSCILEVNAVPTAEERDSAIDDDD